MYEPDLQVWQGACDVLDSYYLEIYGVDDQVGWVEVVYEEQIGNFEFSAGECIFVERVVADGR